MRIFRKAGLPLILLTIIIFLFLIIKPKYDTYKRTVSTITAAEQIRKSLQNDVDLIKKETKERVNKTKELGIESINQRITAIDNNLKQKVSSLKNIPRIELCILMGDEHCDSYFNYWKLKSEIKILTNERDYLITIRNTKDANINLEFALQKHILKYSQWKNTDQQIKAAEDLPNLQKRHEELYLQVIQADSAYQKQASILVTTKKIAPQNVAAATAELARLRDVHVAVYNQLQDVNHRKVAAEAAVANLATLQKNRDVFYLEVTQANDQYQKQKQIAEGLKNSLANVNNMVDQVDVEIKGMSLEIDNLIKTHQSNWMTESMENLNYAFSLALTILISGFLLRIAIKCVYYFVFAPITSRRAAVVLLSDVSGHVNGLSQDASKAMEQLHISTVSCSTKINEIEEILIHPEYLNGSGTHCITDTKWVLDWAYPLSSMAAGLFALTRIRTASSDTVFISAAQDPLAEVAVISIPTGSAFVFQPRRLIGVIQPKDHPVKITKHWRLGSLHAWMTLQLRFLVFHGPVKLIVTGCRGIKIEPAGTGHSINQAGIIGFSANLAYSTKRAEPFNAYLTGSQELLNDSFAGGPGYFVYEVLPHDGKKGGLWTGRGLDGLTDAVQKVFGA